MRGLLLLLQFLSSDDFSHLSASLLKPNHTLMQLLYLLLLYLVPDLVLPDPGVYFIDLPPYPGYPLLPVPDLAGDIEYPPVLLADLEQAVPVLHELPQLLLLALQLILSYHHRIQVLTLMSEEGSQLLDFISIFFDLSLDRV